MKILSLFDGMSVAQQALKNMGFVIETYYASEIDPYAIAVTASNHPETVQLGSVTDIKGVEGMGIDLMIGGSPCQDLSIAKKNREGLKGARSGLFYEYVRIRDEVKPSYFILENVASMPKEAKDQISEILGVQPIMINASLVSAQNRKRLFWVGRLVEVSSTEHYWEQVDISQPDDRGILLKDVLESDVGEEFYVMTRDGSEKMKSNTVRSSGRGSGLNDRHNWDTIRVGTLNSGGQGDRIYSDEGKSVALSAHGGGRGAKTGLYIVNEREGNDGVVHKGIIPESLKEKGNYLPRERVLSSEGKTHALSVSPSMMPSYAIVPEATKQGYAIAREGDAIDLSFPNSSTPRGRVGEKVKNLMTSQNIGVFTEGVIRKLTPVECLRLQSMPDGYFDKAEYKGKPISNTQRYKMCGNAFNCAVIEHILSHITKDNENLDSDN